jgi:SAM-dependent methyltransferase
MTLQVAVLGIDGSGKSTLARALPMALSAELGLVAGSAGDDFAVFAPEQDHMAPGFHPRGLPLAARLARLCRWLAKRLSGRPALYPYFKLANLMFQDDAAVSIARRTRCDVMVSDGNLILSATGRGGNYRRGATHAGAPRQRSRQSDLEAVYRLLLEGRPLPPESVARLPSVDAAAFVARLARRFGFDGVWLPDVVIFLDLPPAAALERIKARGGRVDRHENRSDMTRARETYLKALSALDAYRGEQCVRVIDVQALSPAEALAAVVEALRERLESQRSGAAAAVLGTPEGETVRNLLNWRYLIGYLIGKLFQDAWREPLFPVSAAGRRLLREGYSAGVMRVIYERDSARLGVFDRAFFGYPLHLAVYDRLQILTRRLEPELEARLSGRRKVRIFTAPSGFAYDLFRPLEAIAARRPALMAKVELVAADLDPHGELASELTARARRLGIGFTFVRGDITSTEARREFERSGPYDVALFVGLSSWLPKPRTLSHLRWLREQLRPDGVLVSDCFGPAAYSYGGRYVGYRAQYYTPELYRALLEYAGYQTDAATVEGGRNGINHVVVARRHASARRGVKTNRSGS